MEDEEDAIDEADEEGLTGVLLLEGKILWIRSCPKSIRF